MGELWGEVVVVSGEITQIGEGYFIADLAEPCPQSTVTFNMHPDSAGYVRLGRTVFVAVAPDAVDEFSMQARIID